MTDLTEALEFCANDRGWKYYDPDRGFWVIPDGDEGQISRFHTGNGMVDLLAAMRKKPEAVQLKFAMAIISKIGVQADGSKIAFAFWDLTPDLVVQCYREACR